MATKAQYSALTKTIIRSLEKGTVPWQKPWKAPREGFNPNVAHNGKTGRPYHGLNLVVLWVEQAEHGYLSNSWLTWKQTKELGGRIIDGQERKSTLVSWWEFKDRITEDEKTGETKLKRIGFVKFFGVYNLDQTEDVKLPAKIAAQQPDELPEDDGFDVVEAAQTVMDGYLNSDNAPGFKHHGVDRAYYNITQDYIRLPLRSAFREPSGYYATAFHEMGHSTGAASRLNRFDPESTGDMAPFGSATYSKEELVAELTSAFLSAETGIDNTLENATAYIAGWLRVLKNDSSMVSKAATKAQQAANLILSASTEAEGKE